jgi:hypothetical protein
MRIGTSVHMSIRRVAQFALAITFVLTSTSLAFAQNLDSATAFSETAAPATSPNFPMPGALVGAASAPLTPQFAGPNKRPALLLPLYASAAGLQAMDVYTTYRGMNAGAHETNPLVRNGNAATTIALKTATTGLGIVMAEKMWKKNKAAAIATMVATNVVTGLIVANNYRVINAQKTR